MLEKIEIQHIIDLAKIAGEAILKIYQQDFSVEKKADNSPLTLADKTSNDIITQGLQEFYPEIPVISEESKQVPYANRKEWKYLWMVDPLDGTKEFINKNGEFTVNIALIHEGVPELGVVYIPATGVTYYAVMGKGTFMISQSEITIRLNDKREHYSQKSKVKVVASRSHLSDEVKEFIENLKQQGKEVDFISAGSSLKFCLVAEGQADVYPRFGPTMEWDTAAAHIVATEAGLQVLNANTRQPLIYNKEDLLNPWFIVE
ncbi:MAG: 3'(2'),5'-bisphosphate nucleotidase CysQ [Chitinophagales bacterium]|nr:3'(2'),5'-bisphosphate nucleotidase CysQ [Chitinophagales bacterium]